MEYLNVNPWIMVELNLHNSQPITVCWCDIDGLEYKKGQYTVIIENGHHPMNFRLRSIDKKNEHHHINMLDVAGLHTSSYYFELHIYKERNKKTKTT